MKRAFLGRIQISSQEDIETCLRKNFKGVTNVTFLDPVEDPWQKNFLKTTKVHKQMLKYTKKLKSAKTLNLKSIDFCLEPSEAIQFAKNVSRIDRVSLKYNSRHHEQTMLQRKAPIKDKIWLKFIRRLRGVDYNLLDTSRFSKDHKPLKTLKVMTNHQLNLKMLRIQLPSEEISPEKRFWKRLLHLKKLETLAIDGGIFDKPINSLQNDLKYIDFTFHHKSSVVFVSSAVKLTTQLFQLKTLNLTFSNDAVPTVTSDCCMLSQLHQLRKVNLGFNMSSGRSQSISCYLDALKNLPLTHFGLRCSVNKDSEMAPISYFIRNSKSLESLKLEIVNLGSFKGNGEFLKIANSVGRCEALKSLSLVFTTTAKKIKKTLFPKALGNEFVLNFSQLKSLENLKLECNQFDEDKDDVVLEILEALTENTKQLKCLELEIGKYSVDNNIEFEKVLNAMNTFEKISLLKIWSLEVQNSVQLNGLAGCISSMKNLREFAFGNIHEDLEKMDVANGITKMLYGRNLSSLYWKNSKNFMKNYSWKEISKKEIAKINPFLKNYSTDLLRILNKQRFYSDDDYSSEEDY